MLTLIGAIMGLDTSSLSIFLGLDVFNEYFKHPNTFAQGIIAAANPVGGFIGCILASLISEKIGSINTFKIASTFWILGSILSFLVLNQEMLIIGRLIKGITVGIFGSHVGVYVSEISPTSKKELLMSLIQLSLTIGIAVMFFIGYACTALEDTLSFRVAWLIEIIPAIIILCGSSWCLPESPKFLISKKKWHETYNILTNFKKVKLLNDVNSTNNEYEETEKRLPNSVTDNVAGDIERAIDAFNQSFSNTSKCKFRDLFRDNLLKNTLVGLTVQIGTQLTGINVLMYFLVFICEMIGLKNYVKLLATSFQYVINTVFTIFPILFLAKMRRKDIIVFGELYLGVCLLSIACIMAIFGKPVEVVTNPAVQWEIQGFYGSLVLALCYVFVAVFASTIACSCWVYTEEIFPIRAKSKGVAICTSISWFANIILTFLGPVLLRYLKWGTFLIFGVSCVFLGIFIAWKFPETFRKTDIQVERFFTDTIVTQNVASNVIPYNSEQKNSDGIQKTKQNQRFENFNETCNTRNKDFIISEKEQGSQVQGQPENTNSISNRSYFEAHPPHDNNHINKSFSENFTTDT